MSVLQFKPREPSRPKSRGTVTIVMKVGGHLAMMPGKPDNLEDRKFVAKVMGLHMKSQKEG